MEAQCASFAVLLALTEGRLVPPDSERWARHVAQCPRCATERDAILDARRALRTLHAAELQTARTASTWSAVAAAVERPALLQRLPAAASDSLRMLQALGQPAVAGTFAALVLGLSAGTWLAISTERAPATAAADTYDASSLLTPPSSGIAEAYFDSSPDAAAASGPAADSAGSGGR